LGELDEAAIAKLVEAAPEVEKIDTSGVKRLVLNFESAYTENTKLREKYADQYEKFVESEMKLHKAIRDMQAIATAPEHYIELLRNGTHDSLLSLLSHDNTDIAIDVIDLLRDFLAGDDDDGGVVTGINADIGDQDEDKLVQRELVVQTIRVFTSQLLKLDLLPHLASCLLRLDENVAEEKQGVYNVCELLENLVEIASEETCQLILEKTKLVKFLVERVASDVYGSFDDVKLYASEILCILAQSSAGIQAQIGKEKGIDLLLQTLSKYRKEDPKVGEEEEMVENICNTLCVSATHADNRAIFLQCEGLELLKLLIKSSKYCKRGAVKILSFFITGGDLQASSRWMDIGGLGTLFSAFKHSSSASNSKNIKKKAKRNQRGEEFEDEEHIISTLAALLTNFKDGIQSAQSKLDSSDDHNSTTSSSDPNTTSSEAIHLASKYANYIERIVMKFAENNFEKLDRLIQCHAKYLTRMSQIDAKMMKDDNEDEARDEDDEDQLYQDRLEAGLFTLQLTDYILVFVSNSLPIIKQRATKLLDQSGSNWTDVKAVLLEYAVRSALELNGTDEDPALVSGEPAYIRGLAESINE
jgi:beta-catenin-like protein 1